MDDGEVTRLCEAAAAAIADARSELLAAAAVDWSGTAADRFGVTVSDLLTDLVRASRRLERARALVVAVRSGSVSVGGASSGRSAWDR